MMNLNNHWCLIFEENNYTISIIILNLDNLVKKSKYSSDCTEMFLPAHSELSVK